MIRVLDENDANEVGDGGTSDAEGDGYKCVICFQDGMKDILQSPDCMEHRQVGQHPVLHMIGIQPSI